jgi:hypothetical protein
MEDFKKLSEVDLSVQKPNSDDEITFFSKLHEVGFVIDMVDVEELKGNCEVVNRLNGQVWKEAIDRKLVSFNRART